MVAAKYILVVAMFVASSPAIGQSANAGANSDVQSGEAGARAGTVLYNQLNKDKPLPLSSGNVLQDTAKNMGAGQSPSQAWQNAAQKNADSTKSQSASPQK